MTRKYNKTNIPYKTGTIEYQREYYKLTTNHNPRPYFKSGDYVGLSKIEERPFKYEYLEYAPAPTENIIYQDNQYIYLKDNIYSKTHQKYIKYYFTKKHNQKYCKLLRQVYNPDNKNMIDKITYTKYNF
tara:strand:- start:57 stop:443 length:387 start_codon:yes stop_codon:yes gene_type:complete